MQRVQVPQRSGGRSIGLDFERRQDLAQKDPRADLLIDQAGVLADPAQAGLARVGALQQRRGVDADFVFVIAAELRRQLFQTAAHDVVIIVAPGVARDPASAGVVASRWIAARAVVELADADDGSRACEQQLRIGADDARGDP